MSRLKYCFFIFLVISLGSCQKDIESLNKEARQVSFSHHISQSKALATLDGVLSNKANEFYTKANEDTIGLNDCVDLLYIVNFQDNNGYAILAADDRIPEPIIALSNSGNVSSDQLFSAYQKCFSKIPQTRLDEIQTQINPQDFYSLDYDDWYIGDFYEGSPNRGDFFLGLCVKYVIDNTRVDPGKMIDTLHLVSSVSIQMPLENKRITRFI